MALTIGVIEKRSSAEVYYIYISIYLYKSLINPFLSGAEPSPALLISPGRRGRRSSTQEKKDTEKPPNESEGRPQEKRPGRREGTTA